MLLLQWVLLSPLGPLQCQLSLFALQFAFPFPLSLAFSKAMAFACYALKAKPHSILVVEVVELVALFLQAAFPCPAAICCPWPLGHLQTNPGYACIAIPQVCEGLPSMSPYHFQYGLAIHPSRIFPACVFHFPTCCHVSKTQWLTLLCLHVDTSSQQLASTMLLLSNPFPFWKGLPLHPFPKGCC